MLKQYKAIRPHSLLRALLASASLCLTMIPAHAASPDPVLDKGRDAKSFAELDTNRDGVIDRKEAQASPALAKSFEAVDVNGDGRVSVEEYAKGGVPK